MDKAIISWANDPTRRIILGLTIAFDGAIIEANRENPFDWRRDISTILKSVWASVDTEEKVKRAKVEYAKELSPAIKAGAKIHFLLNRNDELEYLTITDDDEQVEFTLDSSSKTLRKQIKEAVEAWNAGKHSK